MELKLRIFLTISVPNSHFIALATLIAEKHAPGTQTVTGWPQTSLWGGKSCPCQESTPLIRFATDSSDITFFTKRFETSCHFSTNKLILAGARATHRLAFFHICSPYHLLQIMSFSIIVVMFTMHVSLSSCRDEKLLELILSRMNRNTVQPCSKPVFDTFCTSKCPEIYVEISLLVMVADIDECYGYHEY